MTHTYDDAKREKKLHVFSDVDVAAAEEEREREEEEGGRVTEI